MLITTLSDLSSSVILVLPNRTASFGASIPFLTPYVQNSSYKICNHFYDLSLYVFRSWHLSVSACKLKAKYGSRATVILFSFNKILVKSRTHPKISYQTQFHCLDLQLFLCLKFARPPYWHY